MRKVEISLGGLNCANCARKIEEKVQGMDEIKSANLNFIKRVLKFELKEGADRDKVIDKVIDIVNTTEPGLNIEVVDKKKRAAESANKVSGGCITGG